MAAQYESRNGTPVWALPLMGLAGLENALGVRDWVRRELEDLMSFTILIF